jgi:hypothetical protein
LCGGEVEAHPGINRRHAATVNGTTHLGFWIYVISAKPIVLMNPMRLKPGTGAILENSEGVSDLNGELQICSLTVFALPETPMYVGKALSAQTIALKGFYTKKDYPAHLRCIRFKGCGIIPVSLSALSSAIQRGNAAQKTVKLGYSQGCLPGWLRVGFVRATVKSFLVLLDSQRLQGHSAYSENLVARVPMLNSKKMIQKSLGSTRTTAE